MTDAQPQTRRGGIWAWWPLRLLVLFVALILLDGLCLAAPDIAKGALTGLPVPAIRLGNALLAALVMVFGYRLLVGWIEKRPIAELAAHGMVARVLGGLAIGIGLFVAVYAILFALGVAKFKGMGTTDGLTIAVAVSLISAVGEEIVFRGVIFRIVEEGSGTLIALLISAGLFGLIHLANPGATLVSGIAIMLEAGLLLAASYALTRSLWLPIGLHFGWNFTEGGIFGATLSGGKMHGLLKAPIAGPELLSGGSFGPEASIVAVLVCLAAALAMLVLAARRGHWRPMRFSLKT